MNIFSGAEYLLGVDIFHEWILLANDCQRQLFFQGCIFLGRIFFRGENFSSLLNYL